MDKKKRLFYERPQLEVVELTVTTALLAGSTTIQSSAPDDEEEITF